MFFAEKNRCSKNFIEFLFAFSIKIHLFSESSKKKERASSDTGMLYEDRERAKKKSFSARARGKKFS